MWVIDDSVPVTLVRDEIVQAQTDTDGVGRFSLWRLTGRKSLVGEGGGIRLVVNSPAQAVQVRLGGGLGEGDRFAYQFPAVTDERATWTALTWFRALLPVCSARSALLPERPGRADLSHMRALQVLDGLAVGASQRELAVALFGSTAGARGWQPDSALRAQVRYLIRRARALKEGDYRSLISTDPVADFGISGMTGHVRHRRWRPDFRTRPR